MREFGYAGNDMSFALNQFVEELEKIDGYSAVGFLYDDSSLDRPMILVDMIFKPDDRFDHGQVDRVHEAHQKFSQSIEDRLYSFMDWHEPEPGIDAQGLLAEIAKKEGSKTLAILEKAA